MKVKTIFIFLFTLFTLNSFTNDFVIEENVLVKYNGTDTEVTIPNGVEKIGYNAFAGKEIVSVSFPNSVKVIGVGAFYRCPELISIELPNSIDTIDNYAFLGCKKLTSFYISSSVKHISDQVFSECDKLADIDVSPENPYFTSKEGVLYSKNMNKIVRYCAVNPGTFIIPSSVTDIQGYAFEYCNNLTVVTIPSSVENIESGAFFACEGLKAVVIEGNERTLHVEAATFDHIDLSNCLLIVPNGTKTYYEQLELIWSLFIIKEIKDFESYSINYELNGGNNHELNPDKYIAGVELTLRNAQKEDSIFEGWYSEANFQNKVSYIASTDTGDKTLYAKWKSTTTCNITYELNGGINHQDNPSQYVEGVGTQLLNPSKDGHTFIGWYLEADFQTKVTEISATDTGDKTIYAKWEANIYNITYELDGGINHQDNKSTYTYGIGLTLANPSKIEHNFEGWYLEADFQTKITEISTTDIGDKTIYAKFTIKNNIKNPIAFSNIKVYPTAFSESLTLENAEGMHITICDTQGKIIYSKDNILEIETILTSTWTNGIYFVNVKTGQNTITKKVIKVNN